MEWNGPEYNIIIVVMHAVGDSIEMEALQGKLHMQSLETKCSVRNDCEFRNDQRKQKKVETKGMSRKEENLNE